MSYRRKLAVVVLVTIGQSMLMLLAWDMNQSPAQRRPVGILIFAASVGICSLGYAAWLGIDARLKELAAVLGKTRGDTQAVRKTLRAQR